MKVKVNVSTFLNTSTLLIMAVRKTIYISSIKSRRETITNENSYSNFVRIQVIKRCKLWHKRKSQNVAVRGSRSVEFIGIIKIKLLSA
jgi:hypothetical protein